MSVPDYQHFMRPLLAYAEDGQEKSIRAATLALADTLHLSDDDKAQMLPSGKQSLLLNRVHWARTYLAAAGALKPTKRGHFVITDRGKTLLIQHKEHIDNTVLGQFDEFKAFKQRSRLDTANGTSEIVQEIAQTKQQLESASTPDEQLIEADNLLNARLRTDLVERISSLSPTFFEQLVVDLIVAMGYGGSKGAVAERTQRSGDGGIDGIVNEDPLGLDVVYLQAKKYKDGNVVHSPAVQQFAGALVGRGANKGVFITTSSFSKGAIEFANRVPQKIVLIDGQRLSQLMIQYDVGVRVERSILVKRVDLDYFDEPED